MNVQANLETQNSVPYLTHQDFQKCIKELTDFCDYVTVNLCHDKKSSGIKQYYYNDQALDKLLKAVVQARNRELGMLAAYELESLLNDAPDYTSSVKRFYHRNSLVSSLKPMMIFVQIRLDDLLSIKNQELGHDKAEKFAQSLV